MVVSQFYEPEVVDTPKAVDYDGTVSVLKAAMKYGDVQVMNHIVVDFFNASAS